jgi:hypothetical protein
MGVWQGLAMDSLTFHPSPPCLALQHSAGRAPLKRPYGHFKSGSPVVWATCSHHLPLWTTHAVCLWSSPFWSHTFSLTLCPRKGYCFLARSPQKREKEKRKRHTLASWEAFSSWFRNISLETFSLKKFPRTISRVPFPPGK